MHSSDIIPLRTDWDVDFADSFTAPLCLKEASPRNWLTTPGLSWRGSTTTTSSLSR